MVPSEDDAAFYRDDRLYTEIATEKLSGIDGWTSGWKAERSTTQLHSLILIEM